MQDQTEAEWMEAMEDRTHFGQLSQVIVFSLSLKHGFGFGLGLG
ncbi:hypothetical protein L8N14_015255 [Serratia marcescens]